MKKLLILLVILLGVSVPVYASTTPTATEPSGFDWCVRMRFNIDSIDFEFNVIEGERWTDLGGYVTPFMDDEVGLVNLIANWQHTQNVAPGAVVLWLTPVYNPLNIDVELSANVSLFGIESNTAITIPGDEAVRLAYRPSYAGIEGNAINLGITANLQIALTEIRIYGDGAVPFVINGFGAVSPFIDCNPTELSTPTPSVTPTPSETPIPSDTPTPLNSPTPSETRTPSATPTHSLTPTYTPTTIVHTATATSDGWCWAVINFDDPSSLEYEIGLRGGSDGDISSFMPHEIGAWGVGGSQGLRATGIPNGSNFFALAAIMIEVPSDWVIAGVGADVRGSGSGSASSSSPYVRYRKNGSWSGLVAMGGAVTTSYTARTSPTGGAFNDDGFTEIGVEVHVVYSAGAFAYVDAISIKYVCPPTPTPSTTPTPSQTYTASPITPSATNTPATNSPTVTRTPRPTRTLDPLITPSPTLTPIPISSPWTASPVPPPTSTSAPILIPYTPPPLATLPPAYTNTPSPTFNPMVTATTGTPFVTTSPIFVPWDPEAPYNPGDDETSSGVIGIGGGLISFGSNFMERSIGYMREVIGQFTNIITAWRDTPPTPVPQAWDCINHGLASEVCAIFYILRYTIFGGLLGQINLAVALVVADLWIIFNFIHLGRAILARAAEILKV